LRASKNPAPVIRKTGRMSDAKMESRTFISAPIRQ
jgi:hypothetical protein